MKEASGEANMTVITIILIGVIAAIAIPMVNQAMNTTKERGCCTSAGGVYGSSGCDTTVPGFDTNSYNKCIAGDSKGNN